MDWLCQEFGDASLRDCKIVRSDDRRFPQVLSENQTRSSRAGFDGGDPLGKREQRASEYFNRIARIMELDSSSVQLAFYKDEDWRSSGETPNKRIRKQNAKYEVGLEQDELGSREPLIALLSHEVAYIHLVRQGRIAERDSDQELLCDLTTVFFGLGIINANQSVREDGYASEAEEKYQSYMPPAMFGYSLALFCYLRGEAKPVWGSELRTDVREAFLDSQSFLEQDGTTDASQYDNSLSNQYVASRGDSRRRSRRSDGESETDDDHYDVERDSRYRERQARDESSEQAFVNRLSHDSEEHYHDERQDESRSEQRHDRYQDSALIEEESSDRQRYDEPEEIDYQDDERYRDDREHDRGYDRDEERSDRVVPRPGYCVSCGERTRIGVDLCNRCHNTAAGRRAALRAELARHEDNTWGIHFTILVAIVTLILIVVAAVNTGS